MESISRPLPRNHHASSANFSRKLSNANGFSAKNAYEDVFAGPPKFGAPTFSSRVEDYSEIFGSSRASSIPVLDLSDLDQENVSADFRTSTTDYSSIFVGFRDDDEIGMSYEDMFAGPRGGGAINSSSAIAKTRTPSATKPPLQHSGRLNSFEQNQAFSPEAPNQSFDAVKQFNMSYHKTSQKIKDATKMTVHVAELDAVPGFTCFIDAAAPQHKTQGGKEKPSAINDVRQKMDFSEGTPEGKNNSKSTSPLAKKQTSGGAVRSRSGSSWDGTYSNDKLFNAHEIHLKSHPSKVSPPSSLQANLEKSKGHFKRSMASNKEFPKTDARDCSPDSSDEELDVNSAAAASVAALRKAIEKAQESIRIAKELMEKKEGPQNYSKKGSKSSLKVKGRRENNVATQGNRTKEQNNKETCVRADAALQSFTDMERKNASRSEEVAPGFKEGDAIFRGKIHENLDAAEKCEAARFSELVNTGKHRRAISAFEQADVKNNITSTGKHEHEYQEMKPTGETLEQQEEIIEKAAQVEKAYELEEDIERKQDVFKMAQDWEENGDTLESTYVVHEPEENEKPGTAQEVEETEEKREGFYGQKNCEGKLEELLETTEDEEFFESQDWDEKDNAKRLNGSLELVENEHKQEVPEQELIEKKMKDAEIEENENILREIQDEEVIAKRLEEAFQGVENENRLREACGSSSNEPKQKYAHAEEVSEKRLDKVHEQKMNEEEATGAHDEKDSAEKVPECEWEGNETRATWANVYEAENIWIERDASEGNERIEVDEKRPTDAHDWKESEENISVCERDGNEKTVAGAYRYENAENIQRETDESEENEEIEVDEKRLTDAHDGKESENNMEEWEEEVSDKRVAGAYRYDAAENIQRETDGSEESEEIEVPEEALYDNHFNRVSDASSHDANYSTSETEETCQHEINDNNVKTSPQVSDNNGSPLGVYKAFCEFEVDEAEAVEAGYRLKKKEMPKIAGLVECDAEGDGKDASEALRLRDDGNVVNVGSTDLDIGENQVEQHTEDSELASDLENGIDILVNEFRENDEIVKEDEIAFGVEAKSNPETAHGERWWAENPKEMEASEVSSASKEKERTTEFDEEIKTREDTGKIEESLNKNFAMEEKDSKETASKEVAAKDDLREIEEANKREREREKDRLVVERAIREARERAFAEARERAERAAVERATAEVRQRVLAESRQKLDNASAGTKSSAEKASLVAKLRAERAAVERATSEARERALEKALSQKTTSEARPQAERFVTEKFSGASGNVSSSDSQRFDGTNAESSQRSKARLEKHQRIMQRAAKALEEKNMRDLLAQKEQAERNRLSESLDADIKRWSSGKEGNLRALLSTLQYILGPGSGWQSVSLTDIVTTSAVKKAYRKATLYVHPDKLQQRGASIQQKYICEKVFDLLKAAWNKFNSEER